MQGLQILLSFGNAILDAFGIRSMFLAYVGAVFFLSVFGFGWTQLRKH